MSITNNFSALNINDVLNPGTKFISYDNKTYKLCDIQICKSQHKGYVVPDQTYNPNTIIGEMILTFYELSANVQLILLCIPIYNTGTASNDQYLHQLLSPSDATATYVTLDKVVQRPQSFAYRSCITLYTPSPSGSSQAAVETLQSYIFVFPKGIVLNNTDSARLSAKALSSSYILSTTIRGSKSIITKPFLSKGEIDDSYVSPTGALGYDTIETVSDKFIHRFEYFTKAITPVAQSKSCKGLYTTAQYKCMPFDEAINTIKENPDSIYVTPGINNSTTTLQSVLKKRQDDKNASLDNDPLKEIYQNEEYIAYGVSGIVGLILLVGTVMIIRSQIKSD
jgi:hypothetical protein